MRVVFSMALKELLIALRDRKTAVIIVIAPIIQLIIFGYVVTTDIRNLPMGYIDLDNSPKSREILHSFEHQDAFKLKKRYLNMDRALSDLRSGKIKLFVVFPHRFESSWKSGEATLKFVVDGSDANTTRLLLSQLWPTLRNQVSEELKDLLPKLILLKSGDLKKSSMSFNIGNMNQRSSTIPKLEISLKTLFNPELKSPIYMVPGVIVLIVTIITTVLTAMAVVREKEMGTLEQILVSPMKPWEFILGKTLPFSLLALFDVALIFPLGILLFHLPFRGSPLTLIVGITLYLLSTLSLGLLISTISQTQGQAMMTAFFVLMPLYLLSGLFFPVRSMPPFFQRVAFFNPLTHFLLIARGVLVKGTTIGELSVPIFFLFVFGSFTLAAAIFRFSRVKMFS